MQTLARIRPQAPTLFRLAQPIGVTLLHGRENTDQARPVAPLRQELLDTIFLAYLPTQKLDLNAFGGGESFGAILDLIGQRRRPLGIVFIRDTARAQELFHAAGEANVEECALEHQPVVAGQHAGDDVREAFLQQLPPTLLFDAGVALELLSVLLPFVWRGMLVHRTSIINQCSLKTAGLKACRFGSGYASVGQASWPGLLAGLAGLSNLIARGFIRPAIQQRLSVRIFHLGILQFGLRLI